MTPAFPPRRSSDLDAWHEGAFTRRDKIELATAAAANPALLNFAPVAGNGMARFKPPGFLGHDWPSVAEVLTYKSNGIVTYRDDFSYALTAPSLAQRISNWRSLPIEDAKPIFKDSALNKAGESIGSAERRVGKGW